MKPIFSNKAAGFSVRNEPNLERADGCDKQKEENAR